MRPPKYPWALWLDGEVHEVVHRKDFTCLPNAFVAYLHMKVRDLKREAYRNATSFRDQRLADNIKVNTSTYYGTEGIKIKFQFIIPTSVEDVDEFTPRREQVRNWKEANECLG